MIKNSPGNNFMFKPKPLAKSVPKKDFFLSPTKKFNSNFALS